MSPSEGDVSDYLKRCNNGNSDEKLFATFQERCLHPIALEQSQNLHETIAPLTTEHAGNNSSVADLASGAPHWSDSASSQPASNTDSPCGSVKNVDESATEQSPVSSEEPGTSYAETGEPPPHKLRKVTCKDDMCDGETESIEPSMYVEAPQLLLSAIVRMSATTRPWEGQEQDTGNNGDDSILWSSRLAMLVTVIASLEGITDANHCDDCASLTSALSASFPWHMRYMLSSLKRFEDLEAMQGHLFQAISGYYHNGDALLGTFCAQMAKGIGCAGDTSEEANVDIEHLAQVLVGWLMDRRIHYFVDLFPRIHLYQLLFSAIMKLAPRSENQAVDTEHIRLFRDATSSFILGSVEHLLEDICGASKVSVDVYTTRGVHYAFRLNSRLHHLSCMVDDYVKAISSYTTFADETGSSQFWTVVSPFLANAKICRWISEVDFLGCKTEMQRKQCRLAVCILYLIVLNHQQPLVRSEDIRLLRKFHRLPWVSAIRFCCADPVTNHMVAPLTSALVQSMGEGMLLNLSMGNTLFMTLDEAISDLHHGGEDRIGCRALKMAAINRLDGITMYTALSTFWGKIMSSILSRTLQPTTLPSWIYNAVTHLSPMLFAVEQHIDVTTLDEVGAFTPWIISICRVNTTSRGTGHSKQLRGSGCYRT
ncbi:uncharacterized protein BXIN_1218 [Babesia sp. Xinjiang]|uniref:uncharacterized protein n=1 Tax=Babesia sp. Xinjiang TaxID=462227 RepID=UPI000A261183|nr:uncharacterized protein BXIN_1218 [Babesia sp. Xinjiang]ORM40078.1 hypothetical protein BXIN_1218 [Babesia sp. Xinjiang]